MDTHCCELGEFGNICAVHDPEAWQNLKTEQRQNLKTEMATYYTEPTPETFETQLMDAFVRSQDSIWVRTTDVNGKRGRMMRMPIH